MTRMCPALAFLLGAALAATPGATTLAAPRPETAERASKQESSVPEQDCDRLAQPPRAAMGNQAAVFEGVDLASLRWPAARAACARAMADFPGEVRFVAYAVRAADKGGNAREAARLYRAVADQGYPSGQANLAVLHAAGRGGVPHDDREAVRLWQLAADQGDTQAANNLGTMYAAGRGGLPRDMTQAARWWRAAADQGSAEARGNLRKARRG